MQRDIDVFAPHGCCQPVTRVVGKLGRFLRVAERHCREHRAEDFLLHQYIGRRHIGDKHRQVIEAIRRNMGLRHPATCPFGRPRCKQARDALKLRAIDQRADVGILVERIAEPEIAHARTHLGEEGFRDAFLNEKARSGAADLALIEPDAVHEPFNR